MKIEQLIALGFDEEKAKEVIALHEDDITGLKDKNSELLGKISGSKAEIEAQQQAVEDARQVAAAAKEAELKAAGDMEGLKKHYEAELAEQTALLTQSAEKANDMLKQRDLKDVHFDILSKVRDNLAPAAQAMLNAATDINYDEDGNKTISIRSGDKEFNSTADFLTHAETDVTWSAMLKAPDTKGVGATQSSGQAAGNQDTAFKQRLRESKLIN